MAPSSKTAWLHPAPSSFCLDESPPLLFRHALHVEVHHEPLAQRLVDGQAQGIVQLPQAAQKDHGPVPGIHLEVKQEF